MWAYTFESLVFTSNGAPSSAFVAYFARNNYKIFLVSLEEDEVPDFP